MIMAHSVSERKITRTGWIILGSCTATAVAIYSVATPFILPALRKYCLPYVPATKSQVDNVMSLLRGRCGNLVDLGSGDGRIVIEAAKNKFPSCGIELNYWLVLYSRWASWKQKTSSLTTFNRQDLWKGIGHSQTNLSQFNNIVIFGVDSMMEPLRDKLLAEMREDSVLIACRFPIPGGIPITTIDAGIDSVWMYDRKSLKLPYRSHIENTMTFNQSIH